MRKFLTVFTVTFLLTITASALALNYDYDTKITPDTFNNWKIENAFEVNDDTLYIWLSNPDKESKLNRVILKLSSGFLAEFICWNEDNTSFNIMRRFIYREGMHRYEEMGKESYKDLTW